MFKKPNCPVIAIEEHYWDAELAKTYAAGSGRGRADDGPAVRPRRAAAQGDGRGRHRRAGDLARRAVGAEAAGEAARSMVRGVNDRLAEASRRTRRASPASRRCRRTIRRPPPTSSSARHQARLQGRDDPRPLPTACSSTTSASGRSIERAETARRADLSASGAAAPARDGRLLQGLRQGFPDGGARRPGATRSRPRPSRSAWC